jgi:hypothetical protein
MGEDGGEEREKFRFVVGSRVFPLAVGIPVVVKPMGRTLRNSSISKR